MCVLSTLISANRRFLLRKLKLKYIFPKYFIVFKNNKLLSINEFFVERKYLLSANFFITMKFFSIFGEGHIVISDIFTPVFLFLSSSFDITETYILKCFFYLDVFVSLFVSYILVSMYKPSFYIDPGNVLR